MLNNSDGGESRIRRYSSSSNGAANRKPHHHVRPTYDQYRSSSNSYEVSTSTSNNTSPISDGADESQTIVYFDQRPIRCDVRSVDELFALQHFKISDMFAYIVRDEFYRRHLIREIINVYRLRLLDTHNFRQACGYTGIFPCPNIMPTAFNEYLNKLGNCPGRPNCYNMELKMDCQDQAFNAQEEIYILNPLDLRRIPQAVVHTLRFIGNIVFGQPYYCTTNLDAFACYHSKEEHDQQQQQQQEQLRPVSGDMPQIYDDSNVFVDMLRRSAAQVMSPRQTPLRALPSHVVNRDHNVHP